MTHFATPDWVITILSLAATLCAGLYVRRYVGSLEDYLVAGRGVGLYLGTASLISTEIGIITYMYQAQFGFVAGFSAFVVGLITIAVCFFVGRTGFVITRLRKMELLTIPEFFERRYDRGVRVLAGVLMAFGGSLNLGIFPLIEARFITILTGLDPRHVVWTMAGLLLIALAYTAVGGMVSLILTNYLQFMLLAAGTVLVTLACLRATGWSGMTAAVRAHMDGSGFDPLADLGIGPGFILWQILLWTALMTVWQSVAMRSFSTRDPATGRKVFTLTSVLFLGRAVIPMAWGIAALAFFWGRAEPLDPAGHADPVAEMELLEADLDRSFAPDLERGRIDILLPKVDRLERIARAERLRLTGGSGGHPVSEGRDGEAARSARVERHARSATARREEIGLVAMPWMLASLLPTGLLGLVMAGMLAASVSTYAGYFLGWSSIIAQDIVCPWLRRDLSGRARLALTRAAVIGLTVFIMVWSLLYRVPGPAYFYLQVTANLFMAPTLITIVGGLYWKRASSTGAYLAFLLGASASLGYLIPSLGLSVATAGNLSWGLATLGLVLGSLAFPPRRGTTREERGP